MKLPIFVATMLMVANIAFAEDRPVVLEENQTVVQVNGMVCSFCAYGAEKALSKLDGLDKAQLGDGVLIDIDTHRITLALRPGEKIPLREIYQRIRKAGYDPITFYLRSEGRLERSAGRLLLRDAKSGQIFWIVGGELEGVPDDASLTLQVRLVASQIPELGANGAVKVTIDRLISDSDQAREDG
jgi:copper chaperone CopZ